MYRVMVYVDVEGLRVQVSLATAKSLKVTVEE